MIQLTQGFHKQVESHLPEKCFGGGGEEDDEFNGVSATEKDTLHAE